MGVGFHGVCASGLFGVGWVYLWICHYFYLLGNGYGDDTIVVIVSDEVLDDWVDD